MAGTFTLKGKFKRNDGVTPYVNSTIHIAAAPFPDLTDDVVYSSSFSIVTDGNGAFSITLVTEASLYYRLTSDDGLFDPNPFTFAAPSAGTILDVTDLTVFDPSTITPTIAAAAAASAAAAAASAASIVREGNSGVAGLDANGLPIRSVPLWRASTVFASGQTVSAPDGTLIKSAIARTSRASFDATEQTFWATVSSTTGTLQQIASDARYPKKADLFLNVRDYGLLGNGTVESLTALNAAIVPGCTVYFPRPSSFYNLQTPLPNVSNVRYIGDSAGATSTGSPVGGSVIKVTSGSLFSFPAGLTEGLYFADLSIVVTASGTHMFNLGTSSGGLIHCTWERCSLWTQVNGASLFKATTVVNFFHNVWRDCQLWRESTATVPAFDLTCNTSGLNSLTWCETQIHSKGCASTPFIRLESPAAGVYMTGTTLRNIVGEQNAGGIFHGFGINGGTFDNIIDYDVATYAASLVKVGTGSGGTQSYGCHFDQIGTAGTVTFTTGFHVDCNTGSGHYVGRIVHGPTDPGKSSANAASVRQHGAGLVQGVQVVFANYTLTPTDRTIIANGATVTVTLPNATAVPVGREYVVKNVNAAAATLASAGGAIDAVSTKSMAQFAVLTAISDGSNWWLI